MEEEEAHHRVNIPEGVKLNRPKGSKNEKKTPLIIIGRRRRRRGNWLDGG